MNEGILEVEGGRSPLLGTYVLNRVAPKWPTTIAALFADHALLKGGTEPELPSCLKQQRLQQLHTAFILSFTLLLHNSSLSRHAYYLSQKNAAPKC